MLPFLATISRRPFERAGLRGDETGGGVGWGRWDERAGGGGGAGSADLKADGDRGGWGNEGGGRFSRSECRWRQGGVGVTGEGPGQPIWRPSTLMPAASRARRPGEEKDSLPSAAAAARER